MTTESVAPDVEETDDAIQPLVFEPEGHVTFWNKLGFWFPHIVIVAYSGVILAAISTQFTNGEMPCPLCMLQRMGMILVGIGSVWMAGMARKGTLNLGKAARCYGLMILSACLGGFVSVRQINLHILPGDPGYGGTVAGLHLYTWALITFIIVVLYCGITMLFTRELFPVMPSGKAARIASNLMIGLFLAVIVANIVLVFLEEGFHPVLPDDPSRYELLYQLGIK